MLNELMFSNDSSYEKWSQKPPSVPPPDIKFFEQFKNVDEDENDFKFNDYDDQFKNLTTSKCPFLDAL